MIARARRLPWVEILLALPLLGVVGYGLRDPRFPWSPILYFWWIPGAAVGIVAARTRGFRPLVGALAGMLICFPLCLLPALGLLLGLVALVLSARSPRRYGGRVLAATGIVTSGFVGWLVLTGPIPQPTPDMLRWRLRTDAESAVAQALRTNVGRVVVVEGRPAAPPE